VTDTSLDPSFRIKRNVRQIKSTSVALQDDQINDARRWLSNSVDKEMLSPLALISGGKQVVIDSLREACNKGTIARLDPNPTDIILDSLYEQAVGLGPLEQWLANPQIEQINIKGPTQIELQVNGIWQMVDDTSSVFRNSAHLRAVTTNLVRSTGKELSKHTMPYMNLRFENPTVLRIHISQLLRAKGSDGLALFIRRGRTEPFSVQFLLDKGSFNEEVYAVMRSAAQRLIGCVFLGPVGSGKTVLLEKYVDELPNVPIVGVDDAGDFMPSHPMCGVFQLPESSGPSENQVTLGTMTKQALREGDVMVVAEVRGAEEAGILISDAPSMRCTLTTAHGDTPYSGLSRLVSIAQRPPSPYAGTNSADALRADLASAFPLVVQVDRRGERRFVSGVYHNQGWDSENAKWKLHPIVNAVVSKDSTITWEIDRDYSLDRIKAIAGLDLMQLGRTQSYEDRNPAVMMNRVSEMMNMNQWLDALHTLSQMEPTEQVRQKVMQVLDRLPAEKEEYRAKAEKIIAVLDNLEKGREWTKAVDVWTGTKKHTAVQAMIYSMRPDMRQKLSVYKDGANEVVSADTAIRGATEVLKTNLPWKELERALNTVLAVDVGKLPPAQKRAMGEVVVALYQGIIVRCGDQAQKRLFTKRLSDHWGNDKTAAWLSSLEEGAT
jgi:type IV secretory pathway ATPase VirB11/archaellum biosynthesis ATPase